MPFLMASYKPKTTVPNQELKFGLSEKHTKFKKIFLIKGDSMNLTLIDNYVVESFFF